MDQHLLAFIGIATLVVVVPGPDMALVARNVIRHGRAAGYATSVGICVGTLGWALAAGLGVATLLAASATAFTALKLGVFFLTLLPQFIAPGDPVGLRVLQLALVFDVIGITWLLTYTTMLGAICAALGRPGPRRAIAT